MTIRAIFVDLGGVLVVNKAKEIGEKYEREFALTSEKTRSVFLFMHTSKRTEQETEKFLIENDIDPDLWKRFTKDLYGSETRNDELIGLLISLKSKGIKIVFTTNNAHNLSVGIDKYQLQGLADLTINSSEYQVAKPNKEYWEVAFRETKKIIPDLSRDEILVIDDSRHNCESAEEIGFKVFKYSKLIDSEEMISKIIFKDKIFEIDGTVRHESAGGFLFCHDQRDGIMVALVKKIDGSFWMPKGHMQENETPEAAAMRELIEELSLDEKPILLKKIGVESYSFTLPNDTRKHFKDIHIFIFKVAHKVKLSNKTMETISGEKGRYDNPEWLSISDAEEKLKYDRETLIKSVADYLSVKNQTIN